MKGNKLKLLYVAAFALVFSACSDDEDGGGGNLTQPVTFASSIQALEDSEENEGWSETLDPRVAVRADGEVKRYQTDTEGKLTSSDPFYWEGRSSLTVDAWYPYNNGVYQEEVVVKANQSTPSLFQQSNLMEVIGAEVTPDNPSLTFVHRTVRVACNLTLPASAAKTRTEGNPFAGATVTLLNINGVEQGNRVRTSPNRAAYIPPQTIPAGTEFIEITYADGRTTVITLTSDSGSGGGSGNTGGSGGSGSTGGGTSVANKQGIVKADALNFRSGPGTNYGSIGLVYIGTQVTILEETNGWYKVTCVINGVPKTGYMSAEFITVVGANDEPWEGDPDESFEEQIADFPESYKNALRRLHEQHPSWKFVAKYTGLDFEDSVSIQNSGNRSMIYVSSTTPFSWLSTAPGDYDWATDTYYNKDGASWKGASKELIAYYMDPRNFLDESQIFMFESQAYDSSQSRNVVAGILDGTFMEDGKGYYYNGSFKTYVDTFMEAGAIANVSPYILASRSRQEVGSYSGSVSGESGYYNFFNIGAYASSSGNAVTNGLNYAATPGSYRRPWTNQYLSIVGGAEFLAESYIARGQNTDYFQKFNVVSSPYHSHQYMGNIQAPSTEGLSRYTTYEELGVLDEAMTFIIPVYDNMPASAAAMPAPTGNPNSYIKSLSVSGASLNATFTYNKLDYTAVVSNSTTGITISATPVSQYGTIISGTGYHSLNVGNNTIEVVCQAGNGTTTTYTIVVYRSN